MNINEKKFTNYFKLFFIFLIFTAIHSSVSFSENIIRNEVEDPVLTGEELVDAHANVVTILDFSGSMGSNSGGTEVGNWDGIAFNQNETSRMDSALSVLLDVLDSDDSLDSEVCNDESGLWSNTPGEEISCRDFLYTPSRDVSDYIYDGGTITPFPSTDDKAINLPSTPSSSIRDQLTDADADNFNINFLPMYYSGEDNGDPCDANGENTRIDDQSAYGMASGGFQGGDAEAINRVWDFYRQEKASGGTPLALILGFDDASNPTAGDNSSNVKNDAILAFSNDMPDDPALDCRAEFVIVITDGDDSCSGDCGDNSNSCSGRASASSNANRRSSINAVSKLRTHFSRNPVSSNVTGIGTVKKEVITFVVGLGIDDPNAVRALNAMALAGGTHTKGIIKHIDPATGKEIGSVSVDPLEDCIDLNLGINHDDNSGKSAICGSENDGLDVFRAIGRGDGIGSDNALVGNCGNGNSDTPYIDGECEFEGIEIFDNNYFDESTHRDGTEEIPIDLNGFVFLVDSPEELTAAIQDIFNFVDNFTTTGVAPSAPESAGNVTLRDRMFLALTTPLTEDRIWQGRLALYSFVDDPNVPGRKLIVRKPDGEDYTTTPDLEQFSIFTNGRLNSNAREYHWEAGTLLANNTADSRNIFTVGTGFSDIDISATGVIRYTGDTEIFEKDNETLTPETFGISNEDVTSLSDFPPAECVDCSNACAQIDENNINDSSADDCRNCIKDCFRDQIIDFISG